MTLFSDERGAKYYDPQEATKRIHEGDFVSWACNMITKDKDFSFVDDGRAKYFEEAYFMAIRSNYLPLRQGYHFEVEPYSPHRFARQFGFFQEVPGILSQDVRRASLEDGIRYWRLCISSKTMENLEDEVLDIEDDEAPQDSQESILGSNLLANTLPVRMGSKAKLPHHVAVGGTIECFLFAKAAAYDKARSSSSEKLSKGLLERQLKEANTRLQDAKVKESEEVSKIQSTMDELERIEKKLVI
ncbi:UNVERIFIED_CONTAM: hypothetical protein Slati_0219000 [Sesamum latifolium]|uniref:Uncharacterized protein n=1 Tax=Sesamum latifolium TaxID=2727402 RepID=A0AAW2YC32_9LAMI